MEYFRRGSGELDYVYVLQLVRRAAQHFRSQPTLVELTMPRTEQGSDDAAAPKLTVVGDLHGQLQDLFTVLQLRGMPSENNMFIFNGDFVDRGNRGVEVCVLLFALVLVYPKYVFCNRGNHESRLQNRLMGFQEEVNLKYPDFLQARKVFDVFQTAFDELPLATLISSGHQNAGTGRPRRVLVLHGGIGDSLHSLEQV